MGIFKTLEWSESLLLPSVFVILCKSSSPSFRLVIFLSEKGTHNMELRQLLAVLWRWSLFLELILTTKVQPPPEDQTFLALKDVPTRLLVIEYFLLFRKVNLLEFFSHFLILITRFLYLPLFSISQYTCASLSPIFIQKYPLFTWGHSWCISPQDLKPIFYWKERVKKRKTNYNNMPICITFNL